MNSVCHQESKPISFTFNNNNSNKWVKFPQNQTDMLDICFWKVVWNLLTLRQKVCLFSRPTGILACKKWLQTLLSFSSMLGDKLWVSVDSLIAHYRFSKQADLFLYKKDKNKANHKTVAKCPFFCFTNLKIWSLL